MAVLGDSGHRLLIDGTKEALPVTMTRDGSARFMQIGYGCQSNIFSEIYLSLNLSAGTLPLGSSSYVTSAKSHWRRVSGAKGSYLECKD